MNKQLWMKTALDKGLDSFEIYQSFQSSKEVTWFENKMDTFVSSRVLGTSIRGIKDGNMANMALEQCDDGIMESCISSLIEQTKVIGTKEIDVLRNPEEIEQIEKKENWIEPSMEQIQNTLKEIEAKALSYDDKIVQVSYLSWQEEKGYRQITNTNGIDVQDHDQVQYIVLGVVAQKESDIKDYSKVQIVENIDKLDIDEFVEQVCEKAISKLDARPISSRVCPVIFERKAMTALFSSFTGLFSGDLIHKGISCLKGKENQSIFSDKITIIDDPRNTDALSSISFDDEGCPTKRKVLVDHGVFTLALQSTKSGIRNQCESTGNGFKSGYASPVAVQPFNCFIEAGNTSFDDLCKKMKDGLVITSLSGLHAGIDFVSTDFSLQCAGYTIKDGKKDQNVTLITVAANFMELMNSVVEVGSDLEWEYHQVVSPSIYFKNCSISGE